MLQTMFYHVLEDFGVDFEDPLEEEVIPKLVMREQQLVLEGILSIRDWAKKEEVNLEMYFENLDSAVPDIYLYLTNLKDEDEYFKISTDRDINCVLNLLQSDNYLRVLYWKMGKVPSPYDCTCCCDM